MSYSIFLDNLLLPVTPEKVVTKIVNKNQTIDLINGEQLNLLKSKGLTEIEFDFLLPSEEYPFASYVLGFVSPKVFLDRLDTLKRNKQSCKFTLIRSKGFQRDLFNLNMRVSIEDYHIVEDHSNGFDILVSVKLRQFDIKSTKTGTIDSSGKIVVKEERSFLDNASSKYIVKTGDNLFDICQMVLGDGDLCTEVATKNGLKSPLDIKPGMLLNMK